MMKGAHIVLVADAPIEERLRAAMPELNGELRRWPGSARDLYVRRQLAELVADGPGVVAFGPELPPESVLELAAELDRLHPEVEVVVLAEPSPAIWERAARAGVREVVSPTAADDELGLVIRRTMAAAASRRSPERPPTPRAEEHRAVIVVRSPKGGSGKTMIASNVAVALASQHPGDVVIVDLDLQFGDMSTALGIEPTYTIADATANPELTPTSLKALLSTHRSGLCALCAPHRTNDAREITGDDVAAVLKLLQSAFRYVIVDTAAGTDGRVVAALGEATDVVLVCSMDVSSVRAIRKDLDEIDSPRRDDSRQHVVLNRANSRVALEVSDIEATLGLRVDARIASSRSVPLHMNCGTPVVQAEPSSGVARELRELVHRLAPAPAQVQRRSLGRRR